MQRPLALAASLNSAEAWAGMAEPRRSTQPKDGSPRREPKMAAVSDPHDARLTSTSDLKTLSSGKSSDRTGSGRIGSGE